MGKSVAPGMTMRLRIVFAKTEAMRFTGHLDLFRTWERTIRRAGLPLAYTQGYKPHPRINIASALPLGFTGENELVEIWLETDLPLEQITASLKQAAPPGLEIRQVEAANARSPNLQAILQASEYIITLLQPFPYLERRLAELLSAESLPRQRGGKNYDLRNLIITLENLPDDEQGHQRLLACLSAREAATGRPEEVILALGANPEMARIHRRRLILGQPDHAA